MNPTLSLHSAPQDWEPLIAALAQRDRADWLALLLVDQRGRWARGQQVGAEEYVARIPGVAADAELVLDLVYGEMLLRRERGEQPRLEDYLSRFPDRADSVRRQFLLLEMVAPGKSNSGEEFPRTVTHHGATPLHVGERTLSHPGPNAPAPASDAFPTLPGYEVLGKLGAGGMGVVYKAQHLLLKRLVAVKMMLAAHARGEELSRFRSEAESVARLKHPNIVQIHDIGEYQGQPYFSLEFVEGGSLDRRIAGTPQPPRDAAALVTTLAGAMEVAHRKGIIHRDLKPANILLEGAGPTTSLAAVVPKVTDFGLAKQIDAESGQTRTGMIMGTPSYMAPEQAEGRLDDLGPWTDTYALGAILYELLTGRPPFKGQSVFDTLDQVRRQEPVSPRQLQPTCPRNLDTICLKALRKKHRARYLTASELADDLQRFLDGKPIRAREIGRLERLRLWVKRSPMQATLLGAGVVVLLLLLAFLAARLESVENANQLAQQKLQEEQKKTEEGLRLSASSRTIDERLGEATRAVGDQKWDETMTAVEAALALIQNEPLFQDHPLLPQLHGLKERAEAGKADVVRGRAERSKQDFLQPHHRDAVFFATPFTGLDLADNLSLVEKAARAGLAVFGVVVGEVGPPRLDPRYFSPDERRVIAELCCELLLVHADALLRAREPARGAERVQQALALLDRAEQLGVGATHAGLMCRAECLERSERKEEAARVRTRAEGVLPDLAIDFFFLGLQQYRRGEYRSAVPLLAQALKRQQGHYGAEYLLAVCHAQEGHYQETKIGLTRCLKQRPDFPWPRLLLGFAEMELNNFPAAQAEFETVLQGQADPLARYVALVNRGVLRARQQRWDEGVADVEAAIALRPQTFVAYHNLAVMHRRRVEPGWQEAVLSLGVGSGAAWTRAAVAGWQRTGWQRAVAALDQAVSLRDRAAILYQERARLLLKLGEPDRAREDLLRAIGLAPKERSRRLRDDLFDLAQLFFEGEEFSQAVVVLDILLDKQDPEHAPSWRLKAKALFALHQDAKAGAALDQYLDLAPEKTGPRTVAQAERLREGYRARGIIHARLNEYRAAADTYTRGLELGREPELLSLRGWVHLTLGAAALARADFDEVLQQRKEDADALLGRATARVELGDWKGGVEDAEKGLSLSPPEVRPRYAAARVLALAHGRRVSEAGGRDAAADRLAARALELLRLALPATAEERRKFWSERVEKDPAMAALARGSAMQRLGQEVRFASE